MPSLSSVPTLSTCCLLVSGFFTEIAQHIHSLRARGVRSSHTASASASEARVCRKSSGNSWTTPPEISLLVIVINLYYSKIALSRKDCRGERRLQFACFLPAELTKIVCICSLVERLDLLPMAVRLMIGGKLPAHFAGHLPALSHTTEQVEYTMPLLLRQYCSGTLSLAACRVATTLVVVAVHPPLTWLDHDPQRRHTATTTRDCRAPVGSLRGVASARVATQGAHGNNPL